MKHYHCEKLQMGLAEILHSGREEQQRIHWPMLYFSLSQRADIMFGEIVVQSQLLPKLTNSALSVNDNGPGEHSYGWNPLPY